MSGQWVVCDPRDAAQADTRVVVVDVPHFADEVDYEGILGRHLTDPASLDWFASGGVLVLATVAGGEELRLLAGSYGPSAYQGVRHGLERLALERQMVALRRVPG